MPGVSSAERGLSGGKAYTMGNLFCTATSETTNETRPDERHHHRRGEGHGAPRRPGFSLPKGPGSCCSTRTRPVTAPPSAASIAERGGKTVFRRCDVGCESRCPGRVGYGRGRVRRSGHRGEQNFGLAVEQILLETTAEEFNAVLNTNLTSMFLVHEGCGGVIHRPEEGGPSSTYADLRGGGSLVTRPITRPRAGWPRLHGPPPFR